MKPPPPMLPAAGCVTARANAVATAASTALPPRARTAAPVSHAIADEQTTRPSFEENPSSRAASGAVLPTSARAANSRSDCVNFIGIILFLRSSAFRRKPQYRRSGAGSLLFCGFCLQAEASRGTGIATWLSSPPRVRPDETGPCSAGWRVRSVHAGLAGSTLSPRRGVRRRRDELRAVLRGRRRRGVVPVRRRGERDAHRSSRDDRLLLARLPAGGEAGTALRLPRARTVGAGSGSLVQPREAAARSVCESPGRWMGLERGDVPVPLRQSRRLEERSGQRAVRAEGDRRRCFVRLGPRSPAEHTVAQD